LGFAMRLAMSTSALDFHQLDLCHTRHTKKELHVKQLLITIVN